MCYLADFCLVQLFFFLFGQGFIEIEVKGFGFSFQSFQVYFRDIEFICWGVFDNFFFDFMNWQIFF